MVVGILKNKNSNQQNEEDLEKAYKNLEESSSKEDLHSFRQKVYENTLLNAKLTDSKNHEGIRRLSSGSDSEEYQGNTADGHHFKIPKDVLQMRLEQTGKSSPPTTPTKNANYEDGENIIWNKKNLDENEILKQQYQDIHVDEPKTPYQGAIDLQGEYYKVDEDEDDLDGFSLGDPVVAEPKSESAEKPKKSFAEMRKAHYNLGTSMKKGKELLEQGEDAE